VASTRPGALLDRLDRLIDWATEGVAAFLVVVEVLILFTGVVWRYVLDLPLVWAGERAATSRASRR